MRLHVVAGMLALGLAPVGSMAQEADPAAGQRVFAQCRACHTIDAGGRNTIGPNLHGVVDRRAAAVEGFRYSQNLRTLGEGGHTWSEENLRAYLTNPRAVAPQGSMAYPGLRDQTMLNNLIAYLKTQGG